MADLINSPRGPLYPMQGLPPHVGAVPEGARGGGGYEYEARSSQGIGGLNGLGWLGADSVGAGGGTGLLNGAGELAKKWGGELPSMDVLLEL